MTRFRIRTLMPLMLLSAVMATASCTQAGDGALMTPADANAWLAGPGASATLIDARTPGEHAAGVVPGTDLLADWNAGPAAFAQAVRNVPKDQPVVVYCRSGARSSKAAAWLRSQGFTDVRDIQGGMIAWQGAGLPVARP